MPPGSKLPDTRPSLTAHVADKAAKVREKYGPNFAQHELNLLLADRAYVRYPCRLSFDPAPLLPGEMAHPVALGDRPEDGFVMHVHPRFAGQWERVVAAVLYQLVVVNYGGFASAQDAETFGAGVLGLSRDEYYHALCAMADELGGSTGQGGGCS